MSNEVLLKSSRHQNNYITPHNILHSIHTCNM